MRNKGPLLDRPEDIRREKRSEHVAVQSRIALRKWRNTGDLRSLRLHLVARDKLKKRGITDQVGRLGWDDSLTSATDRYVTEEDLAGAGLMPDGSVVR